MKIQKKCQIDVPIMIYTFESDCINKVPVVLTLSVCVGVWGGAAGYVFLLVTMVERPLWWSQRPPYGDPLGR